MEACNKWALKCPEVCAAHVRCGWYRWSLCRLSLDLRGSPPCALPSRRVQQEEQPEVVLRRKGGPRKDTHSHDSAYRWALQWLGRGSVNPFVAAVEPGHFKLHKVVIHWPL